MLKNIRQLLILSKMVKPTIKLEVENLYFLRDLELGIGTWNLELGIAIDLVKINKVIEKLIHSMLTECRHYIKTHTNSKL